MKIKRIYQAFIFLISVSFWSSLLAMELEIINVFDIADSEQRSDFVALDIPQWLAVRNAAESWERAFSDDI